MTKPTNKWGQTLSKVFVRGQVELVHSVGPRVAIRVSERGQGTTEFGTIIAILVLIVVAAMSLFRNLAARMGGV